MGKISRGIGIWRVGRESHTLQNYIIKFKILNKIIKKDLILDEMKDRYGFSVVYGYRVIRENRRILNVTNKDIKYCIKKCSGHYRF